MKLHVPPEPCSSCPYRNDTPPGVWHEEPDEYACDMIEKLQARKKRR